MRAQQYFLAPVTVNKNDKSIADMQRALVSRNSVYRVFEETPDTREAFLRGQLFSVLLDGREFQGKLVRECGMDGVHYNVKFQFRDDLESTVVGMMLSSRGFESPWKREFARIPLAAISGGFERPLNVIFPKISGTAVGQVVNYSVHGMFFEYTSSVPSYSEFIDQRLKIKIVTTQASVLQDVEVRIARIYDEVVKKGHLVRGFGLKIVRMGAAEEKHYHHMIRNACMDLKKESWEKADEPAL